MRVNGGRKDDPFCPVVASQEIDYWIIPSQPGQDRRRRAGKCGYQNNSMPWLENEHFDLTFSIILALRSRAKTEEEAVDSQAK
jgi:hypothetical protein